MIVNRRQTKPLCIHLTSLRQCLRTNLFRSCCYVWMYNVITIRTNDKTDRSRMKIQIEFFNMHASAYRNDSINRLSESWHIRTGKNKIVHNEKYLKFNTKFGLSKIFLFIKSFQIIVSDEQCSGLNPFFLIIQICNLYKKDTYRDGCSKSSTVPKHWKAYKIWRRIFPGKLCAFPPEHNGYNASSCTLLLFFFVIFLSRKYAIKAVVVRMCKHGPRFAFKQFLDFSGDFEWKGQAL